MLKHPALTERRIAQFIERAIQPAAYGARTPMQVEFCPEAHADAEQARLGPWQPVEPGFTFGPAYRMVWFRAIATVPERAEGTVLVALPQVAVERTVWLEGQPWIGLDSQHDAVPLGRRLAELGPISDRAGDRVELWIQAYARNPQASCHGRVEREPMTETYTGAWIVEHDPEVAQLAYDAEFALSLMRGLDERGPSRAILLRALDGVCNTLDAARAETVARCRKTLRDAIASLDGDVAHSITAVGHAHLDTAWLWPLDITRLKMAHTTATQLTLLDRYPEYVFVHSQASQYEWLETQYPALFARLQRAIAEGRWEPVGSMWVEADCNLAGGEALVRQFLYGRKYFEERFGYAPTTVWIPDVFGYPASLPQIFKKSGMTGFLTQKISWNQFNRFPHHTFWWQGIDGTRLWTHFPPADTYCGDGTPSQLLTSVRAYTDHARCDQSLYLFGYGDGGGGPTERHIEYLRRAQNAPCLPTIELGRTSTEFFAEAATKSRDLMVWSGELYLELHRGTLTSQAANKRFNRMGEFALRDAEFLSCFRDDYAKKYPAAELERLWKVLLLNQFHDILPGSSVREVYEESDRDYAAMLAGAEKVVDEALRRIAGKMHSADRRRPIALFHNSTLAAQAAIPWDEEQPPTALVVGKDAHPVQLVEEFDGRKIIFAAPHQALGSVVVADLADVPPNQKHRLKARERRLENDEWSVRFDAHGNITSISGLDDKSVEFIEPGGLGNLFQLIDDRPLYWDAWDLDLYSYETAVNLVKSESFEVVERGPVRAAVELVKRFGDSTIRQRISLGPMPGIRFDTEVDWREEDKMLKVAFPLNVNAARATYEIQFGAVERPTHCNTTWDMARFEVCAHKWADLSENGHGAALLNDGKYGYDAHENVLRLSLLRSPKAPDPECDMGLHRFTYVLLPHYDGYHQADVVAAGYALNAPVRWAMLDPKSGAKGEAPPFIACTSRDLVVDAVKKAEEDDRLVVRLYEAHNCRGSAALSCARGVQRAWLADLMERPQATLDVVEGRVEFEYRPFEIVTILLEV